MRRSGREGGGVALIRLPIIDLLNTGSFIHRPFVYEPVAGPKRLRLGTRCRSTNTWTAAAAAASFVNAPEEESDEEEEWEPLVLPINRNGTAVAHVPKICAKVLRPHQRDGVEFIFRCLMGLSDYPPEMQELAADAQGCILADDMGLGKTLQSISIIWTLLQNRGEQGDLMARKILVVCPASLVGNWSAELDKWLKGQCKHTAVNDTVKAKILAKVDGFKYDRESKVLIASYECVRIHLKRIEKQTFDLLIADEAHRLKNADSGIAGAIAAIQCKRRILLTGTPLQNDLQEFFTLAALTNPVLFGDPAHVRKQYVIPITAGTNPDATDAQIQRAKERLDLLSQITNAFVLRRSNLLLRKVLPDKINAYVFCALTPVQVELYTSLIEEMKASAKYASALSLIQLLCKVCTHPLLVPLSNEGGGFSPEWLKVVKNNENLSTAQQALLLSSNNKILKESSGPAPAPTRDLRRRPESTAETLPMPSNKDCVDETLRMSGKFLFLVSLIEAARIVGDRIVVVSNFTQSLDLVERFCQCKRIACLRLDGGTSIKKRQQIVTSFNQDPAHHVFLLSSKAGGAGINLIGANRLVLMDTDWNPANDKQALARVWRDGQKKTCVIYRLFAAGSIEEKILQRQLSKDMLSSMVMESSTSSLKGGIAKEILRALFAFDPAAIPLCGTHDILKCIRCQDPTGAEQQLLGDAFAEDQLNTWSHTAKRLGGELKHHDGDVVKLIAEKLCLKSWWPQWSAVSFTLSCYIKSGLYADDEEEEAD